MSDMPLVPDAVQQMKLRALQDEIQQINYVLYCLWNITVHGVEGVQMPANMVKIPPNKHGIGVRWS